MKLKYLMLFILIIFFVFFTGQKSLAQTCDPGSINKHPVLTGDKTEADIPMNNCGNHIYSVNGNLEIKGSILEAATKDNTGVVFVSGNLIIGPGLTGKKLTFGSNTSGLVFTVKGNVIIHKSVEEINAVIISEGTIYTAVDSTPDCIHTNPVTANQLVINGSLISLNAEKKIEFCRTLPGSQNNTLAAEKINAQPKYMVILRDLMSDTLQKWSEIDPADTVPI